MHKYTHTHIHHKQRLRTKNRKLISFVFFFSYWKEREEKTWRNLLIVFVQWCYDQLIETMCYAVFLLESKERKTIIRKRKQTENRIFEYNATYLSNQYCARRRLNKVIWKIFSLINQLRRFSFNFNCSIFLMYFLHSHFIYGKWWKFFVVIFVPFMMENIEMQRNRMKMKMKMNMKNKFSYLFCVTR